MLQETDDETNGGKSDCIAWRRQRPCTDHGQSYSELHRYGPKRRKVASAKLIGQPTILIVTPSKDAAEDTRMWAKALRKNIDQNKVRIRDVLAIDLPFSSVRVMQLAVLRQRSRLATTTKLGCSQRRTWRRRWAFPSTATRHS